MKNRSKIIAFMGIGTALALILAYVETLLPPLFTSLPGIKMGLPNIVIVFLLYRCGAKHAFGVSLLRTVLAAVLFGNPLSFAYSVAGALSSFIVMALLRRFDLFSMVGVSVAGGIAHNIGQIATAILLLETVELGYYLVFLALSGLSAGILVGLCAAFLFKKLPS